MVYTEITLVCYRQKIHAKHVLEEGSEGLELTKRERGREREGVEGVGCVCVGGVGGVRVLMRI